MRNIAPPLLVFSLAAALVSPACRKEVAPQDKPAGIMPAPPLPTGSPPAVPAANPNAGGGQVEAEPEPPDPRHTISGTIILPKARKKDVTGEGALFIIVRRAGGPPGPASMLAVQKHPLGDFPMKFTISGRDAMIPGTPFEGSVSIAVRFDKDSDAMTRRKGDVHGQVNAVNVGTQDVQISLDTVQTEDHTLGNVGMPGMPPGHP